MEYIIQNVENKTFVKVNGKLSAGISYLKIFEDAAEAKNYIEENLPSDENLQVVKYEGFTS